MSHCLQCECEIPDSMLFCDKCSQQRTDPALVEVTAPALPPPVRPAVSGRELLLIVVAFVAAGLGTFKFLSASAHPEAAAAPLVATASPSDAASHAALPVWTNSKRWLWNERHASALELRSNNEVHVWMRDAHPILVVRCASRRTEAFVFTESAAQIEPQDERHTVRLRFDGGPEIADRWLDSDDHDALFAPDAARLVSSLLAARTMSFGYTPHNAPPAVAEFNVKGFREAFDPLAKQCGRNP